MISLNSEQKQAVEFARGLISVTAGPGSGKTRVIAARVDFLCRVLQVPAWQIVVLTFSNKAAAELTHRLGERAKEGVKVGTFHSFCASLLASAGCRGRLAEAKQQSAIVKELLRSSPEGDDEDEGVGQDEGQGRAPSGGAPLNTSHPSGRRCVLLVQDKDVRRQDAAGMAGMLERAAARGVPPVSIEWLKQSLLAQQPVAADNYPPAMPPAAK